jgi:hypothetical protein
MMAIADPAEIALRSKTPQSPSTGLITLITRLAHHFGKETPFDSAPPRVGDAFGNRTMAVVTLVLPPDKIDAASQFTAALCADIEDEFGEVYGVLVLPASDA